MPTSPSTIQPLPATPDRADRATFSPRATALFDAIKVTWQPELQGVANVTYHNAVEAASSASSAGVSASNAAASAVTASGHVTTASNWAQLVTGYVSGTDNSAKSWAVGGTGTGQPSLGDAKSWASKVGSVVVTGEYSAKEWATGTFVPAGSAMEWAAMAPGTLVNGTDYSAKHYAQSALNAPGTSATSTTSLAITAGSKALTIQTGKAFAIGQWVIVANTATPSNYLIGQITAYNSTTGALTVNASFVNGTGTFAAWTVSLTARPGASALVSLTGPKSIYVTQAVTYTITDYNVFSSYGVSVSAGTASISGDTISVTAPGAAQTIQLTVTVDGIATSFPVVVQPAGVLQPTNVSPANGATGIGASPTLQSSDFATAGATDTHASSRWRVYQGATLVHDSGWSTTAKTSYTVPAGVVAVSMTYSWTVEHRGTTLGDSQPSAATNFTTAAEFTSYIPTPTATPANFGDALEGGFYAGMVWEQLTQSATSTTIGTGSKTFTVPSMVGAPIVYAGQTLEVRSRANPANKMVGTVTNASGTSLTISVSSVGGSGTFSDWSVMARFRIIVAPKASGENAGIALKNANTAFPTACQTLTEGLAATQAMRDADTSTVYPAAHWARNLNIGGRTDWYIPARDELELCWRNLKPVTNNNYTTADRSTSQSFNYANNGSYGDTANTHGTNNNSSPAGAAYTTTVPAQTAATAFRTGGAEAFAYGSEYYWSSSEYDASGAWCQDWDSSPPGGQFSNGKTGAHRVRAVRRSVI